MPGGTTTFSYDAAGQLSLIQANGQGQVDYHAYGRDLNGLHHERRTRLGGVTATYELRPHRPTHLRPGLRAE